MSCGGPRGGWCAATALGNHPPTHTLYVQPPSPRRPCLPCPAPPHPALQEHRVLHDVLLQPGGRCHGWKLVLCGHSLGAGCAFLLALYLRQFVPELRQGRASWFPVLGLASAPALPAMCPTRRMPRTESEPPRPCLPPLPRQVLGLLAARRPRLWGAVCILCRLVHLVRVRQGVDPAAQVGRWGGGGGGEQVAAAARRGWGRTRPAACHMCCMP